MIHINQNTFKLSAVAFAVMSLLIGCAGGGDSTTSSTPATTPASSSAVSFAELPAPSTDAER